MRGSLVPSALRYVDQVARFGSIQRAAKELNIAASAVNRHILLLEHELGVALFERVARGMRLQKDVAAWEMSTVPAMWARLFDDFDTARRRNEDLLRAFDGIQVTQQERSVKVNVDIPQDLVDRLLDGTR